MFTGIVEDIGSLIAKQDPDALATDANISLTFLSPLAAQGAKLGDSIAVDGVCLTVTELPGDGTFAVDVMPETLRHTALRILEIGAGVNIERAMPASGRLDGHIVQGHVDGVGHLAAKTVGDRWVDLTFELPADLAKYVAPKGSITVSGTSLTVTHVGPTSFGVSLIPTTLENTTLGSLAVGDPVNLEVDVIAKYVERLTNMARLTRMEQPGAVEPAPVSKLVPNVFAASDFELYTAAMDALRAGHPVLVADDLSRENEIDVILAAEYASPKWLAWTVRHSSGYVCAPMTNEIADRLELPLMVPDSQDPLTTAYTVSVDASAGISTGISAADRATTLRALAAPDATATDLIRPGHILPLRAVPGGLAQRRGHTEATVALCQLAGLRPVGVIAELMHDDGTMMRLDQAVSFARDHNLVVVTIEQIARWVTRAPVAGDTPSNTDATAHGATAQANSTTAQPSSASTQTSSTTTQTSSASTQTSGGRVIRSASAKLPTKHGRFTAHTYQDLLTGAEHLVVVSERPGSLVRVHSECLTGDAFGSARCDCGPQLDLALELVAREGGAVIYLRGQEGRGIGLSAKVQAYALQDQGLDTVDANVELGLPADAREYGAAAAILADLATLGAVVLKELTLLTNNPAKLAGLAAHGVTARGTRELRTAVTADNRRYLRTKQDRMGHTLSV